MTKFEDQLFDDLMREHRATLAHTTLAAPPSRHVAARRTLVLAGAGGLGVAAAAGAFVATSGGTPAASVAGGARPAYAVSTHPDGTVTLAVYQASGIAGANAKLHRLGDQVVVVPVRAGCPAMSSVRAPAVGPGVKITVQSARGADGSVTVDAKGIPAGDILVVGAETTGHGSLTAGTLSSPPAPSCISLPSVPLPDGGSGSSSGSASGHG